MSGDPRVLIDATAIPADRGGVGRYVDNLVAALDALGAAPTVVCQTRDADVFATLAPGSRIVPVPPELEHRAARMVWEQTTLPRLAGRLRVDLIHSPHYTMPLRSPVPIVVTLHDATFFSDPASHLPVKARFFRQWTRTSVRRAAVAVVPSVATADELIRYAKASRRRLQVAHHGVDREVFRVPDESEIRRAAEHLGLSIDPGWIAFLGTLEPRKNVPALIRGYAEFAAGRVRPPALVLAGSPGWDTGIEPELAAIGHRLTVLRPGHLPVGVLAGFLGGAQVLAYPSLGEGFGLPVLEGMACGAAVLTTRRLSLPEVGGDAVAYTDVGAGDISSALTELIDDPALRAALSSAASERAAGFTWAACARAHLMAYRAAGRGAG